jgi:hypothetical protein
MDVAAVDAERGVVAADCFLVWAVEQAEDGAFGVVVELDLLDAELVGPPVADVAGDLRDRLGRQLARRLGLSEGTVRTTWRTYSAGCGSPAARRRSCTPSPTRWRRTRLAAPGSPRIARRAVRGGRSTRLLS